MRRYIAAAILLATTAPATAIDSCVTLKESDEIARLVRELDSLKVAHRVERSTVCVDEENRNALSSVISKLFADPSKRRHLKVPRTPSGVAAQSFTFYDATKQTALERSLRRKGIWFTKDDSGTMWYEVSNEAAVRQEVLAIAEGKGGQRSNSTVETDARKSGARGSP